MKIENRTTPNRPLARFGYETITHNPSLLFGIYPEIKARFTPYLRNNRASGSRYIRKIPSFIDGTVLIIYTTIGSLTSLIASYFLIWQTGNNNNHTGEFE